MKNDRKQTIKEALARAIENATDTSVGNSAKTIEAWSKDKKSSTLMFPFCRSTFVA